MNEELRYDEKTGELRPLTEEERNEGRRRWKETVGNEEQTADLNIYEKSMGL